MKTKTCPKCGETKPTKGWHKNCKRPDGLHYCCNDCQKKYVRWHINNLRKTDPSKILWRSTRKSAIERGIPFHIIPQDIIIPNVCPVLGIPLFMREYASGKGCNENTPSVDRIDSTKGYTKDNIVVVSWRANRIKCDATPDEIRKIYEFYCR